MKTHPILFSTAMVQAILEGRKTMTRRVVKPHKKSHGGFEIRNNKVINWDANGNELITVCPYGQPGDVLWVRESFSKTGDNFHDDWPGHGDYYYKADNNFNELELHERFPEMNGWPKWRPSIHMPKTACRIFLEVTSIRVERLNSISEPDAKREGVIPDITTNHPSGYLFRFPFLDLWEEINGKGSWNSNTFVWVIEFKRIDKPENF